MRRIGKWIIILGLLLLLCSIGLMLFLHISSTGADSDIELILNKLAEIMPRESIGSPDDRSCAEMPALELEGRDIIALIRVPMTGTELPVSADWESAELISIPQRFSGSVYDSSLVIGGYDRQGQFDFIEKLDIGYEVSVTDMTGAVFSYTVENIERSSSADSDVLCDTDSDLTLFVRDSGTMEYIIARCVR